MSTVSIAVPYSDRWYFSEIIRGASERAERAGHTVRLHVIAPGPASTRDAGDALERDFTETDTIGAVVAGFKYQAEQAPRATNWERPIVLVGGSVLGYPTVMIDDIGAAREAVQHLTTLGHTRITHLAGTLDNQMDFSVNGRRAKGYRQAMESAGLVVDIVETEFEYEDALSAARTILSRPTPPTAIFAVSDDIAFAVLDAAAERNLRPGLDLSVASIDDLPEAEARNLTTIRQRPADMGATAVDMLLDGLAAGLATTKSRLSPITLINRSSTGRPR